MSDVLTRKPREEREVWNAYDVADYLGCSATYVYEQAAKGVLPAKRMGKRLFFSATAIRRWMEGE